MDKASAYGAGDCRLESCRGHYAGGMLTPTQLPDRPFLHQAQAQAQQGMTANAFCITRLL